MKRTFRFAVVLLSVAGIAFAADPCTDKTNEAKALVAKCKAMDKGSADYKQCASSYSLLKNQAEQACRSGGLNPDEMQSAIDQWDKLVKSCKGKESARCASALQQLGHYQYQLEEYKHLQKMQAYDEDVAWCADRDNKPAKCANLSTIPKADHAASLASFMEYIEKYPKEAKTPNVMFQASFVLESNGEEEKAFRLRERLVRNFSDNGLVPKAWLRMAEYHFNNRKFKDAIDAYKKVTGFENLTGKEAALAMYHLAESYYNIAEFETAAQKYYDYIVGSDAGKYPADLRQEAMDFMAASFSDLDDGVMVAHDFIKDKKVAFKDSLYFRIGMKNKDHDRNEQAVQSFKFLLDLNPNYIDAPLADIAMVEILIVQQKFDEAQEQRLNVVKRYDKNSSWYKKNQQYPESVKNAERAIRSAMLDIPQFYHARAAKLTKEGDTEGGKKEYAKAITSYNEFLKRYAQEPSWDEYKVHINLALVYQEMSQFDRAANEFNWVADVDTLRYGRRPLGSESLLKKEEAAYNAVILMDQNRELAKNRKADSNDVKAYSLPETKAYFAQVDRYMSKFGQNKEAAELAYNAAVVHYNAKQYKTAIQVLRKLRTDFPKHQYTLIISRMLAQSLLENSELDESQKEFEWLWTQYAKVKETRNDSMAAEMEKAIAAVLFQKADRSVKDGKFENGAKAYLDLVKRYPSAEFADKAVFEAAQAYESAKMYSAAAETFMMMPRQYSRSTLTIRSVVRAALAYKKDNKPRDAARTYLFITENFPQDSMAINAIASAAYTYDSIPDKKMAAQTFELAFKKFPKHEKTPGLLYSACLTYDDAKMTEEAIRCSRDVVREYPKSSYALDAAYSIPIAYQNAKNWNMAATEYQNFIRMYTEDKEKLIAAYIGAARAYMELKDYPKATENFKKTIESYDKYGLQIKNADPGVPAEAAYNLGEFEYQKMEALKLTGNDKAKAATTKQLVSLLQAAMGHYAKSAGYASEKWTFRSTNKMGQLFVTMAAKIREQDINAKSKEEEFVERIGIVQQLPTYYEQARPIFQKNIDLARDQGFYNADVVAAEEGYIEMYYRDCATFMEVGDAFEKAPLPDKAPVVQEYMEVDGMAKEDAEVAAEDFLNQYKEELKGKAATARQGGLPKCATGIKASAHYQIDNQWTKKLYETVSSVDSANEVLAIKIEKFDQTKLFRDPSYFKQKARLEQIEKSEVLTPEEQIQTYRDIANEGKAENAKLKEELQLLKARLTPAAAPAPTGTGAK